MMERDESKQRRSKRGDDRSGNVNWEWTKYLIKKRDNG